MFIAALSTRTKLRKESKCPPTDEWIKNMWHIYTVEYYSAIKKNEIFPFTVMWMELESIMLSETSQAEKGKPRNRLLTIENKLMVTRGRWVGG